MSGYGVMVKELFPEVKTFSFDNLVIEEICRIGVSKYSLFTNYEFAGKTYAVSLDFGLELLPPLIDKIKGSFSKSTIETIIYRLVEPEIKDQLIKFGIEIRGFECEAKIGDLEVNANEIYIPFIVERFF